MAKVVNENGNTLVELNSNSAVKRKANEVKRLRREASRLSAIANKRVARLERNNLQDTPAYQKYLRSGGGHFGVAGKTYNEVQKELSRLRGFIDSETSTVRGAVRTLKETARNAGIKYKTVSELRQASPKFFELSSKVEQYLRTVDDMASAIGYQQIWEAISQYTREKRISLASANNDIDSMVDKVADLIKETTLPNGETEIDGWYSVKP